MRTLLMAAALIAAGCSGGAPSNPRVADILHYSNEARERGHQCRAYPSVRQFAKHRAYPAGGQALKMDARLTQSAQAHADWMAATGNYQHQETSAIMAAGGQSENIAYVGPDTLFRGGKIEKVTVTENAGKRFVDEWLRSPGHCHNLMQPQWGHIGIGVAQAESGRLYGVQVFSP